MRALTIAAMAALSMLAGCGDQQPDRATGGAATGAGTGAVIGLIGGPVGVGVGALIGGAVGATTGAAVSPHDLTLPPPPWSGQPTSATAAAPPVAGQGYPGPSTSGSASFGPARQQGEPE
jgi:YMGG-like Gly-zipper